MVINTTYQQYGIFTSEEPMTADLIQAYKSYHIKDILSLDRDSAKRVSQRIGDMSGKNRRLFHHMLFHINPGSPAGEASTLFNNIMNYIPGTPQRPILIHCRAGKDRVGFAVAAWLIKVKRHEPCQTISEVEKNIGYGSGGISPVAKASMDRVLGCQPKTNETIETNEADDVVSAVKDLGYGQGTLVSTTNSDGGFWADNIGFGNQWIDPLMEKYPTPKTASTYWGKKASGIIFVCLEDNTILLLKRSELVHMGGNWGVAGGAVKELGDNYSESEEDNVLDPEIHVFMNSAEEEVREELGSLPKMENKLGETTFSDGNFTYKTFIYNITEEEKKRWTPMIKLNWENDDYQWFPLNQLPGNLHPGLNYTINELKKQQILFNNKIARRRFINRLLKIAEQILKQPSVEDISEYIAVHWNGSGYPFNNFEFLTKISKDLFGVDSDFDLSDDQLSMCRTATDNIISGKYLSPVKSGLVRVNHSAAVGSTSIEEVWNIVNNIINRGITPQPESSHGRYSESPNKIFGVVDTPNSTDYRKLYNSNYPWIIFDVPLGNKNIINSISDSPGSVVVLDNVNKENIVGINGLPINKFMNAYNKWVNRLSKTAKDKIPGGLSDNSKKHFDPKQIEKGMKVEKEHTKDPELRKEITKDHLMENDKYYDYLDEMEKKMEEDKNDAFLGGGPPGSPYAESLPAGLIPGYIEKAEIRRKRREKLMKLLEKKEEQNPPHQPKGIADVGLGRTYDGGELSNTFMTPSGASGAPNAASNSESAGYVQL